MVNRHSRWPTPPMLGNATYQRPTTPGPTVRQGLLHGACDRQGYPVQSRHFRESATRPVQIRSTFATRPERLTVPDLPIATFSHDIRDLVQLSFPGRAGSTERFDPLVGPISDRIFRFRPDQGPPEQVFLEGTPEAEIRATVRPTEFFVSALHSRPFGLGVLIDLAEARMSAADRREAEAAILAALERVDWVVLPPPVLKILHAAAELDPPIADWLDDVQRELARSTESDARALRAERRVDVMRAGARGRYTDLSSCLVEFALDYLYLSHICRLDVARAMAQGPGSGLSSTLAQFDARQTLLFEGHIVHVINPREVRARVPAAEIAWLKSFQDARADRDLLSRRLLDQELDLQPVRRRFPVPPPSRSETPVQVVRPDAEREARESADEEQDIPEPRETYKGLLEDLQSQIVGHPDLVTELALIGTGHIHRQEGTVAPRVLLSGASGSGKTHATTILSDAIARVAGASRARAYHLYCPDLTSTGWRGLELADVISELRLSGRDVLVLCMQEIDKTAVLANGVDGNSLEAKANLQATLLGLLEGSALRADDGDEQVTEDILILATGAFGDNFVHAPTDRELVRWGFSAEFASRWSVRLHLSHQIGAEAQYRLLKHSVAGPLPTKTLAESLDLPVEIADAALWFLAHQVDGREENYRTTLAKIESALRRKLIDRLQQDEPTNGPLVLTPDDFAS